MNRYDYLKLFDNIKDKYVLEALEEQVPVRPAISKKRMLLMAAVIILAVLLVGCTAVYFWLQDMGVGTDTYTQYYDDQGKALEAPIEIERQILTFAGYTGSNANKAVTEWFAFRESYDPEGKLMDNVPDKPEIENNYEWVYDCYTLELADKLDEIAAKYGMKLLDEWVPVQRWQSDVALQEGLGVTTLLKPDAQAVMTPVSGMLYPPYNFDLGYHFRLTGEDAAWTKEVWVDEHYCHKDYIPSNGAWYLNLDSFDQWNYATSNGVELLMAMNKTGYGFMVCEREDAFQAVAVSGNTTGSAYPEPDQVPGRKALEEMAEAFHWGITFDPIDALSMKPAMDAAEETYREENAYVAPVYAGFEDYLLENSMWFSDTVNYTYYDLNSDGEEELLLGGPQEDGTLLLYQLTMKDGQVVEQLWDHYLCEGNVLLSLGTMKHSVFKSWEYWQQDFINHGENSTFLGKVTYTQEGSWIKINPDESGLREKEPVPITQAEADAFRAQFTPMEFDWKPLKSYPLSDGSTIGDYLAGLDKKLSSEELRQFYAKTAAEIWNDEFHTHYRFWDINGDGTEDILLSGDGETYWEAFTYRYGRAQNLRVHGFLLCENGVLEQILTHSRTSGAEYTEYLYFRCEGLEEIELDYIVYDKPTASWQSDLDGTAISDAEAQAVLAKYQRIDQGMRPLSELIG